MSTTDFPNQQVATLKVSLDTVGDISDSDGVAIATAVCAGVLEEAVDQAVAESGLGRLSRDAFAIYEPELQGRFDIGEIRRGSLTVAIGIDEATVA
jgi:hypothetical protein